MGSRRRTLLLLLVALAVPLGLFLLWEQVELAPQLEERATLQLERTARLIAEDVGTKPLSDSLADRLGSVAGLRVTLIDRDGIVRGDSEVDPSRLPSVENHAGRPEVRAALEGRMGAAMRASETVSLRLLYVAVPHPEGVVRVAVPQREILSFLTRTRQIALGTGIVGAVLLLLGSGLLHRLRTAPLLRIGETVRALGAGRLDSRTAVTGASPEGALGRALNDTADRLRDREAGLLRDRGDLEQLLDRLHEGIAVVDAAGQVIRANRAFARWVGRSDVVGQRLAILFRDPRNRETVEEAASGRAAVHETELGNRTVALSAEPHGDGALVVIRDLTRTRQLEGMRRDFVANVSHELKTPLTSLQGFAEALSGEDPGADRVRIFSERILANVERMRHLVDDLLDLARIESGAWSPEPEPVPLAEAVEEAWAELEPGPESAHVRLELEIPPASTVLCDRDALGQILRNLLDNAVRYAPADTPVRVRAREAGDSVQMEVSDSGPGIPEIHLARVFERFYRVDAARSREAGGTGLGLSIVKHLVAAHGGEVGIRSRLGSGTTAWVRLPGADSA
jgi:two-component system, OmpR family, phosphate regulon sensor histidine kinase PhoR